MWYLKGKRFQYKRKLTWRGKPNHNSGVSAKTFPVYFCCAMFSCEFHCGRTKKCSSRRYKRKITWYQQRSVTHSFKKNCHVYFHGPISPVVFNFLLCAPCRGGGGEASLVHLHSLSSWHSQSHSCLLFIVAVEKTRNFSFYWGKMPWSSKGIMSSRNKL